MPTLELKQEIEEFDTMVGKFLALEIPPEKFQRFRLQHGIYGQRQDGVQMVRIKIPFGRLTADQLDCVADLAVEVGHGVAHITTRQDFQIHYVQLTKVPYLMTRLAAVGVTTREACGNTVRNVTASPSAGVDPQEAFDVSPHAQAFTDHMLRNPICQNLGRKFKVAFDGGGVMTALPDIHDMGLIARIKNGQRGFEVRVGGGLGSSPRMAKLLYDFLPESEVIPLGEAILRVFDRFGERKVRMKARMKFLIEKMGFEDFKKAVADERKALTVLPEWNDYLNHLKDYEGVPGIVGVQNFEPLPDTPEFLSWKQTNVIPQKQAGFSMVEIRLRLGDILPPQMRGLAKLLRRYAGGECRTIVHQNLLVRWVRQSDLPAFYQGLKELDLVLDQAQTIYDVTACPGTDTCRLGISGSRPLAKVIEERLFLENGAISQVAKDLRIKISGCPNSCGQHHIANIGFYGGAFPREGHTAPAFQLMLGGDFGRESKIAEPIAQIPSKNIPEAVVRLVKHYVEQVGLVGVQNFEPLPTTFNNFYATQSKEQVMALLGKLLQVPSYDEDPSFYTDWGDKAEFGLQKGVIGECAGAAVSAVVPELTQAETLLQQADALLTHEDFASAAYKAYEAVVAAANALLFHRMVETLNDRESTHEFENHFVRTGIFPEWVGFHRDFQARRQKTLKGVVAEADASELVTAATAFLKDCRSRETEATRKIQFSRAEG